MLACVPALEGMDVVGDEAVGVRALAHAMVEPMRTIVANAGLETGTIVEHARCRGGQVYDVVRRQWVDPWATMLVDPTAVSQTALESSVSMAALALTAEVLVHRRDAPTLTAP